MMVFNLHTKDTIGSNRAIFRHFCKKMSTPQLKRVVTVRFLAEYTIPNSYLSAINALGECCWKTETRVFDFTPIVDFYIGLLGALLFKVGRLGD